jgi:hypothetical protein
VLYLVRHLQTTFCELHSRALDGQRILAMLMMHTHGKPKLVQQHLPSGIGKTWQLCRASKLHTIMRLTRADF